MLFTFLGLSFFFRFYHTLNFTIPIIKISNIDSNELQHNIFDSKTPLPSKLCKNPPLLSIDPYIFTKRYRYLRRGMPNINILYHRNR